MALWYDNTSHIILYTSVCVCVGSLYPGRFSQVWPIKLMKRGKFMLKTPGGKSALRTSYLCQPAGPPCNKDLYNLSWLLCFILLMWLLIASILWCWWYRIQLVKVPRVSTKNSVYFGIILNIQWMFRSI